MAKNFCPICGTALVPGLDACPNCGRMIEPDEPDRMAEPPQAQAQDGTRDAGQSGQESGGAPAADLPESPVREAGAGEPRQAGRLDEPPVTVPAGEIPTQPGPGAPVPPIHGQEAALWGLHRGPSICRRGLREHPVRAFHRPLMRSGLPIIRPACKATDSRNCLNRYPWAPISECPFWEWCR